MQGSEIRNYGDFINVLLAAGFSTGSGNAEGVFAVVPWGWPHSAPYDSPVRWHTGDPETDPWQWRERVLDERDDIAYGKLFCRKSGYITREWYPYFYAARRGGRDFDEDYEDGQISQAAKRIYGVIEQNGATPVHIVKQLAGFMREEKSRFDSAIIELQMKMYLTVSGRQQKQSNMGLLYGWASTVYCKTEDFFGGEFLDEAAELSPEKATADITERILELNPAATAAKIAKFIGG